ncbi:hypothetical protein CEUSTIGMA_g735.t1 [Chlamydomonas eustigma]|uniref:Uncharacterized protein n=1 Tax=Chlamydomonas eustigma TaxID=1157962 RepID=A0A250WR58_9CHLO|nr:hypothetical protein CEUSTIGMA_g735.t1 [Chlamydomonas eustigma]|eukprot:GAX73281.1 hypothetical protein CEUSTIGMA_g735.t1 [Chlamydomonas eustigma]
MSTTHSLCRGFFLFVEVPLTLIGGIFALFSPIAFFTNIVPPHLLRTIPAFSKTEIQLFSFAVEIYGLVLIILAVAELGIFLVKDQIASKHCLLVAMLLGDLIHIWVFLKTWMLDEDGHSMNMLNQSLSWSSREWVALSTNFVLIVVMVFTRGAYLLSNPGPSKKPTAKFD